jgi:hypothetical protein
MGVCGCRINVNGLVGFLLTALASCVLLPLTYDIRHLPLYSLHIRVPQLLCQGRIRKRRRDDVGARRRLTLRCRLKRDHRCLIQSSRPASIAKETFCYHSDEDDGLVPATLTDWLYRGIQPPSRSSLWLNILNRIRNQKTCTLSPLWKEG